MLREPSINLFSILILVGSAQGLFLAFALLFMRRGNRRANLFLAALLAALSAGLLDGFLNVTGYYHRYPRLIGLAWPGNFLVGPVLYFYVRELTVPKQIDVPWKRLQHYLPAIAYAVLLIPFYRMGADTKATLWASSIGPLRGLALFSLETAPFLAALQKAAYYVAACFLISAYSSMIRERFSSVEKISLAWLRTLLVLFVGLCFVFTFYSFFASSFGVYREAGYIFYLLSAVVTFVIAFRALVQPEIFSRIEAVHLAAPIQTGPVMLEAAPAASTDMQSSGAGAEQRSKYQKSSLAPEAAAEIRRRLIGLMEAEQAFLDPELTLPALSERLSVYPHHLSQVINEEFNRSFFDFVNEYRVREAQRMLGSPESEHLSILGIALDAGFNSKSAFYTAFSRYAGTTPSEYRKQQGWMPSRVQGRA